MPLRELPTEQDAAEALLRAERLRQRAADRRRQRLGTVVVVLAVAAVAALLLPGLAAGGRCALWRPDLESLFGRRAGLVLPTAIVVLVLASRAVDPANAWAERLRRWTAAVGVGYPLIVPLALAHKSDRRDECGWTATPWTCLVIGVALAAAAIAWARTRPPEPGLTGPRPAGADTDTPLNQLELRAVFGTLTGVVTQPGRRLRWLAPATGASAVGLVLSLPGPWRELAVPQRMLGDLPLAFPGTTVWSLPGVGPLAWLILLGAAATVATLLVPRARLAAGPVAAGAGALAVAGWLAVVPQLPPTVPGGTGYRIAPAGWLALASAVALLGCGLAATVLRAGRRLIVAGTVLAVLAGSVTAVVAGNPPSYGEPPGAVFEVHGEVVTDAAGLRVEVINDGDRLAARSSSPFVGTLDGAPGHWFLGNLPQYRRTERTETATVFAWRDGVATPLTTVRYSQFRLLGVVGDRLLGHAAGRPLSGGPEPWAVVSIPLSAPSADVSLTSGSTGGRPWVSSGVTVLAHGVDDQVEVSPAGGGAISVSTRNWDPRSGDTWLVPAETVRAGTPWTPETLRRPAEAGARALRVAPDGTAAWVRDEQVMTLPPGGRPRALTAGTAGCRRQPVTAAGAADLAYDSGGNLWLVTGGGLNVVTTDGVRRTAALDTDDEIRDIDPRPDGSLLLATTVERFGGDLRAVLRIDGAARAAASYPPAADPERGCEREVAPAATTSFTATTLGRLPVVDPPSQAGGAARRGSWAPELVGYGGGVRWMRPAGDAAAPDGQGGLWWTWPPPKTGDPGATGTVHGVHVRADGTVTTTAVTVRIDLSRNRSGGRGAAYGDRYAYLSHDLGRPSPAGILDFTGRTVRQLQLTGGLGWATDPDRGAAWAGGTQLLVPVGTGLARLNADGSATTVLGGAPKAELRPIPDALTRGLGRDHYSVAAQWFTGPDRSVWGYDGWYLYRLDGTGRITVLGGQDQGVPTAAHRVTVIGPALYLEVGLDVVKLTPQEVSR